MGTTRMDLWCATAIALSAPFVAAAQAPTMRALIEFDIPPSRLDTALHAYISQGGDQVLFADAAIQGQRSPGVRGRLSTTDALRRLLSGSNVVTHRSSNGVWIIRPGPAAASPIRLAALQAPAPAVATPAPTPPPPAPPMAQDSADIVVTAQRRSESLERVPVSVAVVSGAALQERNIRTLEDLSAQQPSIRIAQAPSADQLHVRGVGSGFNAGFEQSVATFVDGVYRSRSRSSRVALFDIDQVEILRGPQTTFFGANAIAGALNITTRKPHDKLEANASALYSPSDGEYNLEGGISAPLAEGVALRVAGRASGMDGYIRNARYGDHGPHLNDKQGRVSLRVEKGALSVDARFDIARLRDRGTFDAEIVGCPPEGQPATGLCARALATNGGRIDDELNHRSDDGTRSFSNTDIKEGAVTARLNLGPANLVSTTAYGDQRNTLLSGLAPYPGLSPTGTPTFFPYTAGDYYKQFSQELRLESRGDGPLEYTFGGYYEHGRLNSPTGTGLYFVPFGGILAAARLPGFTAASPIAALYSFHQRSRTVSGFGALTYHLTSRFSASAGLRYSRVEKHADRAVVYGIGGPTSPTDGFVAAPAAQQGAISRIVGASIAPFAVGRRVDRAFMPSARLTYQATPDVLAYFSYTRGFKAGGFSAVTPDIFKPEYVNNYEVGLKALWFDRRLVTNLTVYRADYSNLQESQNYNINGVAYVTIQNAAQSRSQGVELDGTYRLTQHLRLRADASYLDAKYISYPNSPCPAYLNQAGTVCFLDASGQRRAFAPKWSGSVGADYDQPLTDSLSMTLGGTVAFTTRYYEQPTISRYVQQDGYAKLDMRVAIGPPSKRWEVAIIGRNLTDKVTAGFRNYVPGSGATVVALPDRPRSIAFQVSGRW